MPGINKKEEQPTLSLTYQVDRDYHNPEPNEVMASFPYPRRPTNLQGLLKFVMETTANEDAPGPSTVGPLDEDRKRFLEDALKSMTVDVIEVLIKNLKVFGDVNTVTEETDVCKYLDAFECILDLIDNIDIANDFYKIGGFEILVPSLNSKHPKIRAESANLLAELCQNNAHLQNIAEENQFVEMLVYMLENETDEDCCIKIVYALSCIIRQHEIAFGRFLQLRGFRPLVRKLQIPNDRLRTKIAFLLEIASGDTDDMKVRLASFNLIPTLSNIMNEDRTESQPSHEMLASLLRTLITGPCSTMVIRMCKDPQINLKSALEKNLERSKDNNVEEYNHYQYILSTVFPN